MNTISRIAQVGIALAILTALPLQARDLTHWTYDRLKREADVILVGEVVQSRDSGELVPTPLWQMDFVGVNTTFQVKGVLHGRCRESELTLFHLRLPDGRKIVDGPFIATFRTQPIRFQSGTQVTELGKAEYLLFLKKRADGRYEPATGPLDSAYSVREVYPSPTQ